MTPTTSPPLPHPTLLDRLSTHGWKQPLRILTMLLFALGSGNKVYLVHWGVRF